MALHLNNAAAENVSVDSGSKLFWEPHERGVLLIGLHPSAFILVPHVQAATPVLHHPHDVSLQISTRQCAVVSFHNGPSHREDLAFVSQAH
jgi:hypothetical protein